jgi:hypothetical protein
MDGLEDLRPINNTVTVAISGIHRGVVCAGHVQAVYVLFDEEATPSYMKSGSAGAGVIFVQVLAQLNS